MELHLLEKSEKKVLIELKGETFTLTNLLIDKLWENKNVSEAAQIKEHPYLSEVKLLVSVKEGSPLKAIERAVNASLKDLKELKEKFKVALK